MITRGIRDFVARDWEAARDAKDDYWAERITRLGPIEGFRIAEELRRQVLRQQPGWPTALERREDLAAHVRLSELLRRADRPRGRAPERTPKALAREHNGDVEISEFIWSEDRIQHIARHNIRPEEFEEVCFGSALVLRTKSEGKNPVYSSSARPRQVAACSAWSSPFRMARGILLPLER